MKKGINYWALPADANMQSKFSIARKHGFDGLELVIMNDGGLSRGSSEKELAEIRHIADSEGAGVRIDGEDLPDLQTRAGAGKGRPDALFSGFLLQVVVLRPDVDELTEAACQHHFCPSECRGKGIGKKMLLTGIKNYGVNNLAVNEDNPQARGFYEHMGFKVYQRNELDDQGNPYPVLYMILEK